MSPSAATEVAPPEGALDGPSLGPPLRALARRSSVAFLRRPGSLFPVVMPLFFAALSTASFQRATGIEGFPEVDGFLDFLLAATITQGVLFGGIQAGADMALDVQDGFFERLLATPVPRLALLLGHLAGAVAFAALQTVFFLVVLGIGGASVKAGPAGVVVLVLYGGLVALAIGGVMVGVALRTGSTEAVQGSFPLVFILLFLSSAFFPTALMSGWYRDLAEANPVSWMVDGARELVIEGWSFGAAAQALGVAAGLAALTMAFATRSLARRVRAS